MIVTRLWFDNLNLMNKYLEVGNKMFIPQLKKQSCKDFEFGILIKAEHVEYVKAKIDMDFIPFTGGIEGFRDEVVKGGFDLQTRHDMDDWMSPNYIREIQKIYRANKDQFNSFVIFAQPLKVDYPSMRTMKVPDYHEKRISMFASLYQKEPVYPVYRGSHGSLWQYADKVFKLPDGLVKWVQHEHSVTTARLKRKGITQVGNMQLYDEDHNWISERNIDPVINILTRTFKRPKSFAKCRESIMSQTYIQGTGKFNDRSMKINHIVGSEVKCDYFPAVKLSKKEGKLLPWNLHLNDLGKLVKSGWVMYLDDDDKLMSPTSVQEIVDAIDHEDQLLIWKVQISTWTAPNDKHFGKIIKKGQVSGIGILFHSKHLPVPWQAKPAGDFTVIEHLSKKLEVKWVNKILTGTQGGKNHHGKAFEENEPIINMKKLVTVGTPTWNNGDIFWLSIESLCRQETSVPWEYIVCECPSPNPVGKDFIEKYKDRLTQAGCVRIKYINTGKRRDLSTKWLDIAAHAEGRILIMHDSDDYTHPLRIQKTVELIGDNPWYDSRFAWHYSITDKKLIQYDYQIVKKLWKTGFNIAMVTSIVKSIPDPHKNAGIHKWLSGYVERKYIDQAVYPCVATTGMNTVSMSRRRMFDHPQPPFVRTNKTISTIGLPVEIVDKLVNNKDISPLQVMRAGEKVEVEFLKGYCRLYKKGEIKKIPRQAYDTLVAKGHVRLINEAVLEPVNIEL